MPANPASTPPSSNRGGFLLCLAVLVAVLGAIFHQSFDPEQVHFANDGPLGSIMAQSDLAWQNFRGYWQDLNWVGGQQPAGFLNLTNTLLAVLGPVTFAKLYPPITLLVLGLSAWLLFRQLRLGTLACTLGAVAVALNTDPFSRACWGVGPWIMANAMCYLSLAALASPAIKQLWLRAALAGAATGLGVMEGFDTGAIYSLFVAAFAFFLVLSQDGETSKKAVKGAVLVALVAVVAAFVAAQALTTLVGTQIKGIAGTAQDAASIKARYDFATQWSLPKVETLRVIIPGLFGYRMDTAEGGAYWGTVGQHPGYEQHHQGYPRHSGSGEYAGVLVVLIALWGAAQSFRKKDSAFSDTEKRMIWFWCAVALVGLLLAWGRHAPFYRMFYALPYASTIRNPIKFMHQFHLGLLIVFAYGLQGLWRRYLEPTTTPEGSLVAHLKGWWKKVAGFDKKWAIGSVIALAASLLGWLMFASSRAELKSYLEKNGFTAQTVPTDPNIAEHIVQFSLGEIGWYLLFLVLSLSIVIVILSGALSGRRARGASVFLGLLLLADLGRANAPWVLYYNYVERYASNPVLDVLRRDNHEQRTAIMPLQGGNMLAFLQQHYHMEWLQYQFPFYNIQSLDIAQEPRKAQEKIDYEQSLSRTPARYWELTNTRFFFGMVNMADFLNANFDPERRRFHIHTPFSLQYVRTNSTVLSAIVTNAGPFALIEFTGALPRAALYSQWQATPGGTNTLATLASPVFDPTRLVLVEDKLPAPDAGATNASVPVKFASYSPRRLTFKVNAAESSVLLLNDRFDPAWTVRVDGQPAPLLRCNYIMRGVHLAKGEHTVEFSFQPPVTSFYVSLTALLVSVGLCGLALILRAKTPEPAVPPSPTAAPDKPIAPAGRKPENGKRKSR